MYDDGSYGEGKGQGGQTPHQAPKNGNNVERTMLNDSRGLKCVGSVNGRGNMSQKATNQQNYEHVPRRVFKFEKRSHKDVPIYHLYGKSNRNLM